MLPHRQVQPNHGRFVCWNHAPTAPTLRSTEASATRRRIARAALFLLLVGCGSASESTSTAVLASDHPVFVTTASKIDVEIRSSAPIRVGRNTFFVSFPNAAGELSAASAIMPAHGHGSPDATIERDGDVFRIKNIVLFMSGRWELHLSIDVHDQAEEITVGVDVP